jgi:ABC-type transport system involved in multi-copper enzyme maturation permease subunit
MDKVLAIARTTYRESIRSKVLFSVLFASIAVVIVSSLFGRVTIGDQVKVIKDFGLMSLSLLSVSFVVVSGSALLHKELSRKTVYNILAKPVGRAEFLIGKYLGMLGTVVVLTALMGSMLSCYVGMFEGRFDLGMVQAYLYILFELVIVCAGAIFFSAVVVTPLLSGFFTLGLFIAGRSAEYVWKFGEISGSSIPKIIYPFLPHLDALAISNGVVYGELRSGVNMVWSFVYVATYAAILLLLAHMAFRRRHFN